MEEKICGIWKVRAMPMWQKRWAGMPVTGMALEDHAALGWRHHAGADVEQRALAGAIGAGDSEDFALP